MHSIAIPAPAPARVRRPAASRAAGPVARAGAARAGAARAARCWRRRLTVVVALVVVAFVATVAVGRVGAEAELADRVAGHVVVEPGQTLWEVAAATAPDGVDTRRQLADLKALNGLESSDVDAWTVVLLPAR